MSQLINHELLFVTDLKYFKGLQIINGRTIFDRYNSAKTIFDNLDDSYRFFLAYPVKNNDKIEFSRTRNDF